MISEQNVNDNGSCVSGNAENLTLYLAYLMLSQARDKLKGLRVHLECTKKSWFLVCVVLLQLPLHPHSMTIHSVTFPSYTAGLDGRKSWRTSQTSTGKQSSGDDSVSPWMARKTLANLCPCDSSSVWTFLRVLLNQPWLDNTASWFKLTTLLCLGKTESKPLLCHGENHVQSHTLLL